MLHLFSHSMRTPRAILWFPFWCLFNKIIFYCPFFSNKNGPSCSPSSSKEQLSIKADKLSSLRFGSLVWIYGSQTFERFMPVKYGRVIKYLCEKKYFFYSGPNYYWQTSSRLFPYLKKLLTLTRGNSGWNCSSVLIQLVRHKFLINVYDRYFSGIIRP